MPANWCFEQAQANHEEQGFTGNNRLYGLATSPGQQSAGAGAGGGGKLRGFRHAIDGSVRLGVSLRPVMAAAGHS